MNDTNDSANKQLETLREAVIKKLEANYAHGIIDLDDFEKRLEMAVHTSLTEDLERLASDLETISSKTDPSYNSDINTGSVKSEETFTCILSGIKRKGKWRPARNNKIFTFLGGLDLDFTNAELPPGETDFEFFCVLGGVDIIVPSGINIEMSGTPILGGIENKVPYEHHPDRPTLRFHGMTFLGEVKIKLPKKNKKNKK